MYLRAFPREGGWLLAHPAHAAGDLDAALSFMVHLPTLRASLPAACSNDHDGEIWVPNTPDTCAVVREAFQVANQNLGHDAVPVDRDISLDSASGNDGDAAWDSDGDGSASECDMSFKLIPEPGLAVYD